MWGGVGTDEPRVVVPAHAADQLDGLDPRSDNQHGSESSRLVELRRTSSANLSPTERVRTIVVSRPSLTRFSSSPSTSACSMSTPSTSPGTPSSPSRPTRASRSTRRRRSSRRSSTSSTPRRAATGRCAGERHRAGAGGVGRRRRLGRSQREWVRSPVGVEVNYTHACHAGRLLLVRVYGATHTAQYLSRSRPRQPVRPTSAGLPSRPHDTTPNWSP